MTRNLLRCQGFALTLIHRQKKLRTSLMLINQGDRIVSNKKALINEVKELWHKEFFHSSMKKRKKIPE
jgi:hypothetical protein